jgi:hypothetical protein
VGMQAAGAFVHVFFQYQFHRLVEVVLDHGTKVHQNDV